MGTYNAAREESRQRRTKQSRGDVIPDGMWRFQTAAKNNARRNAGFVTRHHNGEKHLAAAAILRRVKPTRRNGWLTLLGSEPAQPRTRRIDGWSQCATKRVTQASRRGGARRDYRCRFRGDPN
ncbi:hypothetical protein MRX96_007877 [Rhipicephalus microplus]